MRASSFVCTLASYLKSVAILLALAACALPPKPSVTPVAPTPVLTPVPWSAVEGWEGNDAAGAWPALLASCQALERQRAWSAPCQAAARQIPADDAAARRFFEQWFVPHRLSASDGSDTGLITGYYEPLLLGSRNQSERFRHPIYGVPDDLLTIELASVYPELKSYRLRGRLVGNRVVPYYSREEIDSGTRPLAGRVIAWVDDPVALFFLHIQGSGRILLDSGEILRVGYADQNGHPYVSIGKKLVEWGELRPEQASMQGIRRWGEQHPDKLPRLLAANPSYVFFRELPPPPPQGPDGPPGALGVPLAAGRSLAVDPRAVPLGAPVFLATTWPNRDVPLKRLMFAQDTGGAIKGVVRADFFWGFGEEAGRLAGAMRQQGRMWVLLPKNGS
ncbi:murein transglycosylase A [Thiobacter aerophilum]|uniref:peptidoglycan lytic exotransglycosylase n=1 Tax=Thiobacter aerophilum TaxID=3121275 RepID=A0ABV0EHP0_9BURK